MEQEGFLQFLCKHVYDHPTTDPFDKKIMNDRYERMKRFYQQLASGQNVDMNEFKQDWLAIARHALETQDWIILENIINNIDWTSSWIKPLVSNILLNAIIYRRFYLAQRIIYNFSDSDILRSIFIVFHRNTYIPNDVSLLDIVDRVVNFLDDTNIVFEPVDIVLALEGLHLDRLDLDPYLGLIILQQIKAQPQLYTNAWIQRIRHVLVEQGYTQTASILETLETDIKG